MAGKRKLVAHVFADGAWHKPGDAVPESVTNPKAWGGDPSDQPEPKADPKPSFPEGDPSDAWKVDELKAYAESNSIDLGDAKDASTKAPILEAIAKAKA
jgi:hypothetical protein